MYRNEFLSEIFLMTSLEQHENVVNVIGFCCQGNQTSLVMEWMEHGDLLHFLWNVREPQDKDDIFKLTHKDALYICHQVASGLLYLSTMKIIHGDIAARNILVGHNLNCKISDFGLANDVYKYGAIKDRVERKVPYKWVSPERMMFGEMPITWRSDVWSFGIVMYEIYTLGGSPYSGTVQSQLLTKLRSGYRMARPPLCTINA